MKKRTLIRRIRWSRIGAVLCIAFAAGAIGYGYYRDTAETSLVEYHRTIEAGDTLWGIIGQVATNREDMSRLTWQVAQDNHITDPGHLQPGTEIIIRVKAAREL